MASFKGEYEHSIDSKGRVSFPHKLRRYLSPEIGGRFTILRGLENCLLLYPEDQWLKVEEKLSKINSFNKEKRIVMRNFLRTAEDLVLDSQNRIPLPAKLKKWAEISSKAIFIGMGERIELWSPDMLAREDESVGDDIYHELFEKVMGDFQDD
ncbi:MAG: division/cell wall cluster transcriptional repressor MraZ [Balneolales bacterium]